SGPPPPHGAGDGEILGQHLTTIHQAVMGQPLDRALVTRSGIDQHVATAQRRNRLARIIDIGAWCAAWSRCGQAAVAPQIESVRPYTRWWPALRMAPVMRHIAGTILDPGAGGIEYRWLIHDAGALAFEPVVEPGEIRIIGPEIGLVDEVVLVGANPQFLIADPRLNVVERRQHAGLEYIEPGGHMKTGNIDGAAEIVPRPEVVRDGVGDYIIEIGVQ